MTSDISKQTTAESILEMEESIDNPKEDALMTYIGDRVIDVFDAENALFFAQIGRPSKNYCEEQDIDHVAVNNATDYCLVIAELIHRNRSIQPSQS
jgi:2-hydroxy-3-keto-5-methylthiopentenyl-1-phosphate phosphatase